MARAACVFARRASSSRKRSKHCVLGYGFISRGAAFMALSWWFLTTPIQLWRFNPSVGPDSPRERQLGAGSRFD